MASLAGKATLVPDAFAELLGRHRVLVDAEAEAFFVVVALRTGVQRRCQHLRHSVQ